MNAVSSSLAFERARQPAGANASVLRKLIEIVFGRANCITLDTSEMFYFSLASSGIRAAGWKKKMSLPGHSAGRLVPEILEPELFMPTDGVTYHCAAVRTCHLPPEKRTTEAAEQMFGCRGLTHSRMETALLARAHFDESGFDQLGIRWMGFLHKPVRLDQIPYILSISHADGNKHIDTMCMLPSGHLPSEPGAIVYCLPEKSG